jgi:GTP cyclohydrolase I
VLFLSWADVEKRIKEMNIKDKKIWGIPRGGSIVAGLARQHGAIVVDTPQEADVAVDDIIDSGATQALIKQTYQLETYSLINKVKDGINEWVHFPWEESPEQDIEMSIARILQYIGEDCLRDGLIETPKRVVASWKQLFGGYGANPEDIMKWFIDDTDEMIISKNIQFFSTCEHHMLPFFGKASVAYIPEGRVLGLSKLSRIVDVYSRRLQTQEHLTRQIGEVLQAQVESVGVHIEAEHLCMKSRGVNQQESTMITNYLTGAFRENTDARNEFLMAVNK